MRVLQLLVLVGLLALPTAASWAQDENPVILAMTNGAGLPGEIVEVELLVHRAEEIKGDATRLSGLDLLLSWDPAIAALVSLSTTEVTAGWQLAQRAEAGSVEVSMASLDPVSATPVGLRVLAFRFELQPTQGESPLDLSETRAFDLDQVPIVHVVEPGTLTSSAVPVETMGMGRWKAGH